MFYVFINNKMQKYIQTVQQHYAGIPCTASAFDKIDDMRSQEAQFYGSFSATYTH